MADQIRLRVDGHDVVVPAGATILSAAEAAGVTIPTLCHAPMLKPSGACRMCLVEVEGARGLLTACSTPASDGMVVRTRTDKVTEARRTVLELLLTEHPLDCLTCEKGGDCRLQDYAYEYGVTGRHVAGQERREAEQAGDGGMMLDDTNPFFVRDLEKCILCGRCVRMCAEVMGYGAVDFVSRGARTKVTTAFDVPLEESPCVFCGNCLTICPTGALQPKASRGKGRVYQYEKVRTVCTYCGVGCSVNLHVRDGKVIGASAAYGAANRGLVCVKGHFGHDWLHSPDRLTTPLVRGADGELRRATWDEALGLVASRLTAIKGQYGADVIGGLASAKCTNEDNYLFQRLLRGAIGTNNVDHCARL
jgi:predicted molibdopterin-dependent oxidoreductase YjgC